MPVFKPTLSEFIFRRFMLKHYASNLRVDMNLEAKRETLDYINAKMTDAPYFEKHPQLVHYVVDLHDFRRSGNSIAARGDCLIRRIL